MAALMYDAVTSMGVPKSARASLLPSGHSLDLFVTLTDYYGHHQLVQIHDPPLIHEQEHHHILRFAYRRHPSGEIESDFELASAAGLAFAARATSSFPGAFPPARIVEMDEVVALRRDTWPRRAEFIARCFHAHLRSDMDPTTAPFIDGSVLNNRPFQVAISAIHGRPAYRQVDRRLVYIDPHPAPRGGAARTTRCRASSRPSAAPCRISRARSRSSTSSTGCSSSTSRCGGSRAIIDSARPHVSELVAGVITGTFDRRDLGAGAARAGASR